MFTGSSLSATPTENDELFTHRALELAAAGRGLVSPNPLVGCVVVDRDGNVAGEGTYVRGNVVHAEAIALAQAGEKARGGTAYVSLEPHAHYGKTAPCTDALIRAGVARVVCPIEDPNPLVSGKGFEQLRAAGVEVLTGIEAAAAERLNEAFFCWHRLGRPFVHLKLAMSLDGRISLSESVSTALSGPAARTRVQELRHQSDAILVGSNTAIVDDPSLTDRSGLPRDRRLTRVILDDRLLLPPSSQLARTAREVPTIVYTAVADTDAARALLDTGVDVVAVKGGARDLNAVLRDLGSREIQSVLVEGGTAVAGSFIDAGVVDRVTFMIAPMIIGGGRAPAAIGGNGASDLASALRLQDIEITRHGDDIEITGRPARS